MRHTTTDPDRSRAGSLVHRATSSGRIVTLVAYVEGLEPDPRYEIDSEIVCRTSEQAAQIAKLLSEARTA